MGTSFTPQSRTKLPDPCHIQAQQQEPPQARPWEDASSMTRTGYHKPGNQALAAERSEGQPGNSMCISFLREGGACRHRPGAVAASAAVAAEAARSGPFRWSPGACSASWEDPSAPSGLSPELPVRSTTTTVTLSLHRQLGSSRACLTALNPVQSSQSAPRREQAAWAAHHSCRGISCACPAACQQLHAAEQRACTHQNLP